MDKGSLTLKLPRWIRRFVKEHSRMCYDPQERMEWVVELARETLFRRSGGPFAAAIFDMETEHMVAAGVNMVTSLSCSVLHAEIVAIMAAQQRYKDFDLSCVGSGRFQLVTSAEPCTMCLGAIVWSGVQSVICGARDEDARAIGFDEGPKPTDWVGELRSRGIEVIRDVRRGEAAQILTEYKTLGRKIYNSRRTGSD
ncbi:MAG: nucleoside deaminase [Phycisphaerae bacterium]|nr:nucleoside deaminase [Phycisphaerae bacterium]